MNPSLRLLVCLLMLPPTAAALNSVWYSPNGTGDGSSREKPRAWNILEVNYGYLGFKAADPDVELNLLPGEYLTDPINTATTEPSKFRLTIRGHGRRPEDTVLKLRANYLAGASDWGNSWVSLVDLARNAEYLRRFEAENLTFDGGWDLQVRHNHPGYLRAYKDSPLRVSARTGRIRKVLVRNFGSHGLMPRHVTDNPSGVEIFPLTILTRDEGQSGEDGDLRPWNIEDCEVAGFHSLYAGYGTMVMVVPQLNLTNVAPEWAARDSSRRLAQVRRVQVRGGGDGAGIIAFGSAGAANSAAGKVTFSDNVVVAGDLGFNTDTGATRDLDFTNSLFLRVNSLGALGQPDSGPNHANYAIFGNGIRLAAVSAAHSYDDFGYTNVAGRLRLSGSNTVVLGRTRAATLAGLQIVGAARDIRFSDNWITTDPVENFSRSARGHRGTPEFRSLYKLESMTNLEDGTPARRRPDALNVSARDNHLSEAPWDFARLAPLDGSDFSTFGVNSAPDLQKKRSVKPAARGLIPLGNVERVQLVYSNLPRRYAWTVATTNGSLVSTRRHETNVIEAQLVGAEELTLLRPARGRIGGQFALRARLALQPTPLSGLPGTQPLPGRRVWLEVLPGSRHPGKYSAETDAQGFATFTYPVAAGTDGVDRFRAWVDSGLGAAGELDEFQDIWSSGAFAHGTTVSVSAELDVADARFGRDAVLRLTRSGSTKDALQVTLAVASLNEVGANSVAPELELEAQDRRRREVTQLAPGTWKVSFRSGEETVLLSVANPKTSTRGTEVARFTVRPSRGYAPGTDPVAHVVLYRPVVAAKR